jgi:uncharacterized RDD family membrane protein YckC
MSGNVFCNKCGAPNDASAQFCARCGTSLIPAAAPTPAAPAAGAPAAAGSFPQPAAAYPAGYAAPAAGYPAVQAGVRYGGFWIRVVAAIIDFFLIRIVVHPVAAIFGFGGLTLGGLGSHGFRHGAGLPLLIFGGGVLFVFTVGASWLYEALMVSSSYQATLGKMIFGMKVTDLSGNRLSFAHATGRYFAKWISKLILGIGYIMVGFTARKQGLHDMIAGTLVPRK